MAHEQLAAQIQDSWARGAAAYDTEIGHGRTTARLHDYWLKLLRRLVGAIPLDAVDVGTGTGFLALLLAELGHRVRGVDLTPEMLEFARRGAAARGLAAVFQQGRADALPVEDASADLVVSRHVLWTMPDPRAAVTDWVRVTRPGGRVLWFDWMPGQSPRVHELRHRLAQVVRIVQRLEAPGDHEYPEEAYAALPMLALNDLRAIRGFLLGLGVERPRLQVLTGLAALERHELPFYRRIEDRGRHYLAAFEVTPKLKQRLRPGG